MAKFSKPALLKENAKDGRTGFFKIIQAKSNLLVLIAVALLIGQIPFLSNFLSWQMTFFHEISHGLAALFTGGNILKIEIHFSGSVVCYTIGGIRWLVSAAGYAGAAFWGLLIYLSAGAVPKNYTHLLAIFLVMMLAATGVVYAPDLQSRAIIFIIAAFYGTAIKFREKLPLKIFLKVAGLYILLDALKAPTVLFNHQSVNDATNLASQTGLPQVFWIILWIAIALGCLAFIWKIEKRCARSSQALKVERHREFSR